MSILDYFFPDLKEQPVPRVLLVADTPKPPQGERAPAPPGVSRKPREGISPVEAIGEMDKGVGRQENSALEFHGEQIERVEALNGDVEAAQAAGRKFLGNVRQATEEMRNRLGQEQAPAGTATAAVGEPFEAPSLPSIEAIQENASEAAESNIQVEKPAAPTPSAPVSAPRARRSVYGVPPTLPKAPTVPPTATQVPPQPPQRPPAPPSAPPSPSQGPPPPSRSPEEETRALFRKLTAEVKKQGPDAWRIYEETAETEAGRAKRRSWFQNAAASVNYWLATRVDKRRQRLSDKADKFREMAEGHPATIRGAWWKMRWRSNQALAEQWGRLQNEVENNRLQFEARANEHLNSGIHHINRALIPLQIEHADKADERKRLQEAVKLWSRNLVATGNEISIMDRQMRDSVSGLEKLSDPTFQAKYVSLRERYDDIQQMLNVQNDRVQTLDGELSALRDRLEPLDLQKRKLADTMIHPGRTNLMVASPGYAESQPYSYPFPAERGVESEKKPGDSWTVSRFVDTWNAINPTLSLGKDTFTGFMKDLELPDDGGNRKKGKREMKAEARIKREDVALRIDEFGLSLTPPWSVEDMANAIDLFTKNAYGE